MLIFLSNYCDDRQSAHLLDLLREEGVLGRLVRFRERSIIVAMESCAGVQIDETELQIRIAVERDVEKIIVSHEAHPLCGRQLHPEDTRIELRDFRVGGGDFCVMAGPCTIESEKQTIETALMVKKAGATVLRGGAFKPRTSPYHFQGLKEEGLKILAKARKETGLVVVTEAMSPDEALMVAEYADIIQIGTRNAQNYRLLEACGRLRVPILLKRGYCCTLTEFLMAAEYILAGGNEQLILCERGIRTFETHVRYTMPIGAIPVLKQLTHLPVIVDPSHAAGRADLVPPLSYAAVAAGADGLLVEVHPTPELALCDGRQSLTPEEFASMVKICREIRLVVR